MKEKARSWLNAGDKARSAKVGQFYTQGAIAYAILELADAIRSLKTSEKRTDQE